MNDRRKQNLGLIVALLVAGAARADMVPVFKLDGEQEPLRHVCGRMEVQHANLSGPYDSPIIVDFDFGTVQFLPKAGADVRQSSQVPYAIELTGRPDSCSLCLYALIGLGL